jgi:hypothetical protein
MAALLPIDFVYITKFKVPYSISHLEETNLHDEAEYSQTFYHNHNCMGPL